jgi:hypothetical protein
MNLLHPEEQDSTTAKFSEIHTEHIRQNNKFLVYECGYKNLLCWLDTVKRTMSMMNWKCEEGSGSDSFPDASS